MTSIFGIIMVLIIIVCALLVLVILSQNPKGGGLSSTFGGSGTQMFGVQKTNDFMETATWTLAGMIVVLSILASVLVAKPRYSVAPQQSIEASSSGAPTGNQTLPNNNNVPENVPK